MKALAGGLTFFNIATVSAVLLGFFARLITGGGLGPVTASLSILLGLIAGVAAYFATYDPKDTAEGIERSPNDNSGGKSRILDGSKALFWIVAGIFALFAVRSFCWLLYSDGGQLMIQSPNNLGDLSLHITYIRDFANGSPLWPLNPIYPFGHLRYPAGVDLFNSLLLLLHVELIPGLVWVGLLASVATFYALYRWGGLFTVAGFLFNGGVAGLQFFAVWFNGHTAHFVDYQGDKTIAWKSLPLSMFVTQRGLLYAIPAGLLLLWQWRYRYFRRPDGRPPLPYWVELSLYASLPLFHVHTFLALSIVLLTLFGAGRPNMRGQLVTLVAGALIPATCFVWLITDHFQAHSMMGWHPGWVLSDPNFGRSTFLAFWWDNFGICVPLILVLYAVCAMRAWKAHVREEGEVPEDLAFLSPAAIIIILGLFVKLAPWEWDNLKIMMWGYFIILAFLWTHLIRQQSLPLRIVLCLFLFCSGFVSLFGGLSVGRPGFTLANRAEVDVIGEVTRRMPAQARFAAYPTFNHPLLLQGRNVVLGYGGHLWTQGFDSPQLKAAHLDYGSINDRLTSLMLGEGNWTQTARDLGVRYIFWGRTEAENYEKDDALSTKPWQQMLQPVASGDWGAIYDLAQLETPE
jgi:hypothetical protein